MLSFSRLTSARGLAYAGSMMLGGAGGLALGAWIGEQQQNTSLGYVTSSATKMVETEPNLAHGGMDKSKWTSFTLGERKQVTPNTHLFRFNLEDKKQSLNLPVASCLLVR